MDTKIYSDTSESTEEDEKGFENNNAKKKRAVFVNGAINSGSGNRGGRGVVRCQAQGCEVDLTEGKKRYHMRHKVCELHAKAEAVIVAGLRQRFCQQCSRFHELCEFDYTKRSCRRRLAGHNERRRKSSAESPGEGSSTHRLVNQNNNYHGQNQNDETNIENHYYKQLNNL